jgi:hypothetical protein
MHAGSFCSRIHPRRTEPGRPKSSSQRVLSRRPTQSHACPYNNAAARGPVLLPRPACGRSPASFNDTILPPAGDPRPCGQKKPHGSLKLQRVHHTLVFFISKFVNGFLWPSNPQLRLTGKRAITVTCCPREMGQCPVLSLLPIFSSVPWSKI